jgi:histone acetyltransferase
MFNNRNEVIGGLCFRHFQENQLVEIVFLAISTKQQVQGFGSRLMMQFKSTFLLK